MYSVILTCNGVRTLQRLRSGTIKAMQFGFSHVSRGSLNEVTVNTRHIGILPSHWHTTAPTISNASPRHIQGRFFWIDSVGNQEPISIADIPSNTKYSREEVELRCHCASLYRLVDLMGWTQGIFNHITVRHCNTPEWFLINPYGASYAEVTASNLVTVDREGGIVDNGSSTLGVNKAGFVLHSAVHAARPDINCVLHLHTPPFSAVASLKCGFLQMSQESCIVGDVCYHDYEGLVVEISEQEKIIKTIAEANDNVKVLFLRNHGVAIWGNDVYDAFQIACNLMLACKIQLAAMSAAGGESSVCKVSAQAAEAVQRRH